MQALTCKDVPVVWQATILFTNSIRIPYKQKNAIVIDIITKLFNQFINLIKEK